MPVEAYLPSDCRYTGHHGRREWRSTPACPAPALMSQSGAALQRSSALARHHSHPAPLAPEPQLSPAGSCPYGHTTLAAAQMTLQGMARSVDIWCLVEMSDSHWVVQGCQQGSTVGLVIDSVQCIMYRVMMCTLYMYNIMMCIIYMIMMCQAHVPTRGKRHGQSASLLRYHLKSPCTVQGCRAQAVCSTLHHRR